MWSHRVGDQSETQRCKINREKKKQQLYIGRERIRRKGWKKLSKQELEGQIPIVGVVVTISPSFILYRIVVFPEASRPTIRSLILHCGKNLFASLDMSLPIAQLIKLKKHARNREQKYEELIFWCDNLRRFQKKWH